MYGAQFDRQLGGIVVHFGGVRWKSDFGDGLEGSGGFWVAHLRRFVIHRIARFEIGIAFFVDGDMNHRRTRSDCSTPRALHLQRRSFRRHLGTRCNMNTGQTLTWDLGDEKAFVTWGIDEGANLDRKQVTPRRDQRT